MICLMATRFTRLSVVAGEQQLDASLPSTRPVAEFLADLPALFSLPPAAPPVAWSLSTPRLGPISPERCLDEVGVLDGDVLYLSTATEAAESPFVEDVINTIAGTVDERRPPWRDEHRDRVVTILLAGVAVALAAALFTVPDKFIASALLVVAGLGALGLGHYLAARGGAAVEWTVLAFALLTSVRLSEGQYTATRVMAAVTAALVGLAATALVRRRQALIVAGVFGAAVAGLVGLLLAWNIHGPSIAAWASPALLLALGILPAAALSASGLVGMVQRGEDEAPVPRAELTRRTRTAAARIDGAVTVVGAAGVLAVAALIGDGRHAQAVLGLLLALIFLLRSRGFAAARHVGWLLAVPAAALVATAFALPGWTDVLRPWPAATVRTVGLLGAFCLIALVGYVRLPAPAAARLTRLLDLLDTVAIVALVPVLLLAQGVFGWLADHF